MKAMIDFYRNDLCFANYTMSCLWYKFMKNTQIMSNLGCKVIAEIGINHDGSSRIAFDLASSAAKAGCYGVKFQYRNLSRAYQNKRSFEIGDEILNKEINRCYIHRRIIIFNPKIKNAFGISVGISFFDVDDMEDFSASISEFDFFKIPSVEFDNINLIKKQADLNKPVLLSMGCQDQHVIDWVISNLADYENLSYLHCVSNYPVEYYNSRLGYIDYLKDLGLRSVWLFFSRC